MAAILLVESIKLVRPMVREIVEQGGHIVSTAGTFQEIVRALSDGHFDLMIIDLDGARGGSLAGVEYLRRAGLLKNTKVLALTLRRDRPFLLETVRRGVNSLLLKEDCEAATLLARIHELTRSPQLGGAGEAGPKPQVESSVIPADTLVQRLNTPPPQPLKPAEIQATLPRITNATALRPVVHQVIAMAGNPNNEIHDLVSVVRNDVGLSAKIIAAANSAFYRRRGGAAKNLADAVATIGMKGTRELAMSLAVTDDFRTDSSDPLLQMSGLWSHSIACGHLSEFLARHTRVCDPDQAFIVGLLHDIGRRAMTEHMRAHYLHVLYSPLDQAPPLQDLERTIVGTDHASLGAAVLEKWGCPAFLTRAVKMHHSRLVQRDNFDDPLAGLLRVLVLADAMAIAFGFPADRFDELPVIPRSWLKTLEGFETLSEEANGTLHERLGLVTSRADMQINMPERWEGQLRQIVLLGATAHPLEPLQMALSHAYGGIPVRMPAQADLQEAETLVLADLRNIERRQDLPLAIQWLTGREHPHPWPVLIVSDEQALAEADLGLHGRRIAAIQQPLRPTAVKQAVQALFPVTVQHAMAA